MTIEITRSSDTPWAVASQTATLGRPPTVELRSNKLDLASFLRLLFDWRWLILGFMAFGLSVATVVTLLTKPLYLSEATLEANPPTVEIFDEKSTARSQVPGKWNFVATQVGLLRSRSLALRVAQDLNLASNPQFVDQRYDPATRLKVATNTVAVGLTVKAPEEGQLIGISYVAGSPDLAAKIVNGVAESFIRSNLERQIEASAFARSFLEGQIAKTRADLERSERQLVGYAQSEGIINTGSAAGASNGDVGSLQGASLVALNAALADATSKRIAAEGAYRGAQSRGNTSDVVASTQALRQAKETLEAEYQEKRTLLKPGHPDMISLRSRIDELTRQMQNETAQVVGGRANQLLGEYQAAALAERELQARVAALKGSVMNLRGRSIQYNILQREVDTNRALYDALLQRYKEIGAAGGIGTNRISIVDRGDVPSQPHTPKLAFNLLIGLILSLIAGVGTAVALEFLNDTIKSTDEVRRKLGVDCLGAIPETSSKGSFIEDLKVFGSPISEAYAALAGTLRFATETGAAKSLLIASTQHSEGKSSTALALARNYARLGKTVLLIDADLRNPTFKVANIEQGLTPLLTTGGSVNDHMFMTRYSNLWMMPCGRKPPNPADLLATGRFKAILAEASQRFDFIVVDGPPVLGLADSPSLAASCGGTLVVVEAKRTRTAAVRAAINRLDHSGAHLVGVVLTKVAARASSYGYGYGHFSYGDTTASNEILMESFQADE